MDHATTGTLRLPARLHFGYGARAQLSEILRQYGSRVFAIIDPFLITNDVHAEVSATIAAAGLDLETYSDIQPELPVSSLDAAADAAAHFEPDVILAVGGGSALDAAKLVSLLISHGGPLSRYYGENMVPGPVTPVVAVPTTAGTGSEVTPVAVISDPDREMKVGVSSPHLIPTVAVVDPEYTLGAPASVTAYSGIDALVHAIESYTAARLPPDWSGQLPVFTGRNVFAENLALGAIEHIGGSLVTAVHNPHDRDARQSVALGSLLAGMSFGPTGTHLSHALQYPIGALTATPHGLGTGLMLPYVLDALRVDPGTRARIARVGIALGSAAADEATLVDEAISRVAALNQAIGVPASLHEIGLTAEQLPRVAELAMGSARLVGMSPVPATVEFLLDILTRAHSGRLTQGSTP